MLFSRGTFLLFAEFSFLLCFLPLPTPSNLALSSLLCGWLSSAVAALSKTCGLLQELGVFILNSTIINFVKHKKKKKELGIFSTCEIVLPQPL